MFFYYIGACTCEQNALVQAIWFTVSAVRCQRLQTPKPAVVIPVYSLWLTATCKQIWNGC